MALGVTGRQLRAVAWPHVDIRMLVGLALVVFALVGGLSLSHQLRVTTPVVIAARAIPAGHVVAADDLALAEARLEGPLATLGIGASGRAAVIGQTASVAIPAGAMVVRPDLGNGPVIGPSEVAVTVPIAANTVFPGLRRGDHVGVFATSDPGHPQSLTTVLLERATVYDVSLDASRVTLGGNDSSGGRIANVTILVPRDHVEQVAAALINGKITLALAPEVAR